MRTCTRCVCNDNGDNYITFDENGYCNYCTEALKKINTTVYFPNEEGQKKLNTLLEQIKNDGKGKKYDCVMGLSGGIDSSYLLYLGYKWGLRILVIHIDDGYDTDISKSNIKALIEKTGFDYLVVKPDAEQFNDLTKAFMKAGVRNLAAPQDNVLFAFLYEQIRKYHIKYFLSGVNFALESILQKTHTNDAYDVKNLKDIHRKFGTKPIDKLKFITHYRVLFDNHFHHIKSPCPLDLIDYNRDRAFKELNDFCGFQYYGRKHLENKLTAFVQLVWFPQKFGVDKRTSHLSSMIVSGQMTREEALKELSEPMYDKALMDSYIKEIKTNLQLSDEVFDQIMTAPVHEHSEYSNEWFYSFLIKVGSKMKHTLLFWRYRK